MERPSAWAAALLLGSCLIGACGTGGPVPHSTGEPNPEWDKCTNLSPSAVRVVAKAGSGGAPSPAGGPIASGIYYLTDFIVYGAGVRGGGEGGSPPTFAAVVAFNGNVVEFLGTPDPIVGDASTAGTFSTSGSKITWARTCLCPFVCSAPPGSNRTIGPPVTMSYSADGSQFVLFEPYATTGQAVEIYTRGS